MHGTMNTKFRSRMLAAENVLISQPWEGRGDQKNWCSQKCPNNLLVSEPNFLQCRQHLNYKLQRFYSKFKKHIFIHFNNVRQNFGRTTCTEYSIRLRCYVLSTGA